MKNVWYQSSGITTTAGSSYTLSTISMVVQTGVIIKKIYTTAQLIDTTGAYKTYNQIKVRLFNGQQNNMPNRPAGNAVQYFMNENYSPYFECNLLYDTGTTFLIQVTMYASLVATDAMSVNHAIYWDYINKK